MHLFHKLKTDCKERVRVGKFPAHQIKNKSSIHTKKYLCGQVTFFVLKFSYASWGEHFTCDSQRKVTSVTGALEHMGTFQVIRT